MEYKYIINCIECAVVSMKREVAEGTGKPVLGMAWDGEKEHAEDEPSYLVCPKVTVEVDPLALLIADIHSCDHCGEDVLIAPTSDWFIEKWRAERERV